VSVTWDCERAKTTDGYYQVRGPGVRRFAKSLAAAPFADVLWMETATADLDEAKAFAAAIHARFPGQMLAYNLSPSFSWDTDGMTDDEMQRFPEELGRLGFVFNFITYGGHQIDGLAGRGVRPRRSSRTGCWRWPGCSEIPSARVAVPGLAADPGGRSAAGRGVDGRVGRTATTRPWGRDRPSISTCHTEASPKLLDQWLHCGPNTMTSPQRCEPSCGP